jgi:putative endonuclease
MAKTDTKADRAVPDKEASPERVAAFCTPHREIDLVARRRSLLAFVEIKARAGLDEAAYAVTPRQQAPIIDAAQTWLAAHPDHAELELRFILIAPRHLSRHLLAASMPRLSASL